MDSLPVLSSLDEISGVFAIVISYTLCLFSCIEYHCATDTGHFGYTPTATVTLKP